MAIKVAYHLYAPRFQHAAQTEAEGALLRYKFADDSVGFASLPAWPQFGDRNLTRKLADIKDNFRLEPQWSWAVLDASLRKEGKAALPASIPLPPTHWHLQADDLQDSRRWSDLLARGYKHWKLKVSPLSLESLPLREMAQFADENSVKLRLDANGSFTSRAQCDRLCAVINQINVIDFIEDPSANEELWAHLRTSWGCELACDWIHPRGFDCDLYIYKPTRDSDAPREKDFVITTAFDHPIGLNYTAYKSAQLRDHPRLRKPLGISHPGLYKCAGIDSSITFGEVGFGWGQMLEDLSWKRL